MTRRIEAEARDSSRQRKGCLLASYYLHVLIRRAGDLDGTAAIGEQQPYLSTLSASEVRVLGGRGSGQGAVIVS